MAQIVTSLNGGDSTASLAGATTNKGLMAKLAVWIAIAQKRLTT
jgi:hypothetical protein